MKKIILFLEMLFVYPPIFFSALSVRKSDFSLKYASFKMWANSYLKLLGVTPELIHPNLIPLENGFIFIVSHESAIDSLILADVLPVKANFLMDHKESVPYMNVWFRVLKSIRFDRSMADFRSLNMAFNQSIQECDNLCVFKNSLIGVELPSSFLELAYQSEKILIPVKIKGSQAALLKGGSHKVRVEIGLPLHFEEYGISSYEQCLMELDQRIGSL